MVGEIRDLERLAFCDKKDRIEDRECHMFTGHAIGEGDGVFELFYITG
jgi:hypothetical protein